MPMAEKRNPGRFTIQFDLGDPQHGQVAQILEGQGRYKARFIANAVMHYLHCSETPDIPQSAPIDRKMLETIITVYNGGPVGLETLAATIGEESVTIEDVYEPYLLQIGFLSRTLRGRCATKLAYNHLGIPYKNTEHQSQISLDELEN